MIMASTTTMQQHHDMNCLPHHHEFVPDSSTVAAATTGGGGGGGGCTLSALEMEGGNGRWPRQETLTLLEVRSRLDFKFKEANHKGPLWDEVSS
ncbi:unnamed protein product [Withania somnifera]